jgi:hypothetical protein
MAFEKMKQLFGGGDQIHDHWYTPVEDFQFSTSEFYDLIEKKLSERKVPGLQISRELFHEGGLLSDKREYLRLKRERLVFDICAAPFGTSYFFSFRFVELPLTINPLEVLIVFIGLLLAFGLLLKVFGLIYGFFFFFALVIGGAWAMRNAISLGLKDLDATLLKIPVIAPLYEILFRKETYYRHDTRLMYLTSVRSITESLVEKVTAAKGVKLIKQYDRKPILGELYQPTTKALVSPPNEPLAKEV